MNKSEENIYYISTRSQEKAHGAVGAAQAIVKGIAEDGGLYVPSEIPKLSVPLEQLLDMDYRSLAYVVMKDFLPDFSEAELRRCIARAYDEKFDTPDIAPLVQVKNGNLFLELYHGPTLAFKDMALSILPHLLQTSVKKLGIEKEVVILTATSGDTGKAALEGFADVPGVRIIVFFPEEGVSEIQKRQMLTQTGANTSVIGIYGNFDDAQNGVKKMFTDTSLQNRLDHAGYMFSSANSINIGRLVPQIAYYFYAYIQASRIKAIKLGDPVNFTVPTGNFGNILAAYYAKLMGLPVNRLICASNENKVLFDFMHTGVYNRKRPFVVTTSPSMDILISSNLERLLYHISHNNSQVTGTWMQQLSANGEYDISGFAKEGLKAFYGEYATEAETAQAIRQVYETDGYVIDTHTAVAYAAFGKYKKQHPDDHIQNIIVSTASPYKFTADVLAALDKRPNDHIGDEFALIKSLNNLTGGDIPLGIRDLEKQPIMHSTKCDKDAMQFEVEKILGI